MLLRAFCVHYISLDKLILLTGLLNKGIAAAFTSFSLGLLLAMLYTILRAFCIRYIRRQVS
jgi:hypothetical protein